LTRRENDRVAVVAAVDSVGALAAIRSLGQLGVRVIAAHHTTRAIGLRSRYAEPWLVPDPRTDEEGFVASLLDLAQALPGPAPIFPVSDLYLDAIARNFSALGSRYILPFAEGGDLLRLRDKRHQLDRATKAGVAIPRTVFEPGPEVSFPVIVKSSDSASFVRLFGAKGIRCNTRAELDDVFQKAEKCAPLIQEWIPGADDQLLLAGAYLTGEGDVLGVVTCRKLSQFPADIGTIRVGEAVPLADVAEQAIAFLRTAECYGPSDVEFKRDQRDGVLKFIEANPRLVQWQGLAAAAGVDLAALAYRDLTGQAPAKAVQSPKAKRWAITFLTGSGHERPGYGGDGPVRPKLPYTDAVLAPNDPWPAIVQYGVVARGLLGRLGRS
jgi:D-aspartate ligase